jgi:hypothetical protein
VPSRKDTSETMPTKKVSFGSLWRRFIHLSTLQPQLSWRIKTRDQLPLYLLSCQKHINFIVLITAVKISSRPAQGGMGKHLSQLSRCTTYFVDRILCHSSFLPKTNIILRCIPLTITTYRKLMTECNIQQQDAPWVQTSACTDILPHQVPSLWTMRIIWQGWRLLLTFWMQQ